MLGREKRKSEGEVEEGAGRRKERGKEKRGEKRGGKKSCRKFLCNILLETWFLGGFTRDAMFPGKR